MLSEKLKLEVGSPFEYRDNVNINKISINTESPLLTLFFKTLEKQPYKRRGHIYQKFKFISKKLPIHTFMFFDV